MEGYGGPAQPSPTIAQCLNGGLGWLEGECNHCKTRASLPLDAIRQPGDTPIWKLEAALTCRSCRKGRYAPSVHMIQPDRFKKSAKKFKAAPRKQPARNLTRAQQLFFGGLTKETAMRIKTIALATAFALSSTLAFAQAGPDTAGGSSAAGGPAASKTTTGDSKDGGTTSGGGSAMKDGATGTTTGSSTPSAKDASTQGADTAGPAEKKGDAATPGGTMKK